MSSGVDVAGVADGLVDEGRPGGADLDDGVADEEPGHVEVVDHHVPEQAAGALDVRHGRRRGIARGYLHEFDGSDAAAVDLVPQAPERRVEAAIEADHEGNPASGCRGDGAPRGQIDGRGFFAKMPWRLAPFDRSAAGRGRGDTMPSMAGPLSTSSGSGTGAGHANDAARLRVGSPRPQLRPFRFRDGTPWVCRSTAPRAPAYSSSVLRVR